MKHWPRRWSSFDGFRDGATRSGRDPINPVRVQILRRRGMSYRQIGILIAKQDSRKMPYGSHATYVALRKYLRGITDEDGERFDWQPAATLPTPSPRAHGRCGPIITDHRHTCGSMPASSAHPEDDKKEGP